MYSFEITKLGITQAGRLISEVRKEIPTNTNPAAGVSVLPNSPLIAPIFSTLMTVRY